jgi:hypothetical protein
VIEFRSVEDCEAIVESLREHARQTDVYVGCAPRTPRAGTKDAIRQVWTLWASSGRTASAAATSPLPSLCCISRAPFASSVDCLMSRE